MLTITAYEHVGIRVSDRERALRFYSDVLGFRLLRELPEHEAIELESESGVVINLIVNAKPTLGGRNVLIDEPVKRPGVTHPAFVVANLDAAITTLAKAGISLTEGPLDLGRRRICFVRDPDGTVIEFDEIIGFEGEEK